MRVFVRDAKFYRMIASIAIPVAMQNLITFTVSMMDTVMVGRLGEVQLSAVAIANQVFYVFMILCSGIANGANVMIAQFWGKNDVKNIDKVISLMYRTVFLVVILFTAVALFFPRTAMSIFTTDSAVIEEGIRYLQVIGYGYVFFGIANCTIMMLRAVGTVRISILVYSVSLVVNVFLNWVLIFGNLGAPAMGVRGAALATVIARVCEAVIAVTFMARFENKIHYQARNLLLPHREMLMPYVRTSLPVIFNELLWSLGASMIAIVIGRMGTQFVAANSIASVVFQLVSILFFGISSSASVIIGNTIGSGDYQLARERANTFMVMALAVGCIAGCLMFLLRPLAISFYNVSDLAKTYASQILAVGSVIVVFQALASVSMMGILRGGGDLKFVLFMDVFFMWIVAIPFGFLTGLVLGWPVPAVYAVLKCDELLKSCFSVTRVFRGRWVRDVTIQTKPKP